jgi:RNA polymerase sigma-70 factor, ECF subfamily
MFSRGWVDKTDEELMRLVQEGRERALSELYGRYSRKLVRYFHRMLWRDDEKAQDFLHDLFLKIIEKPKQFNAERKFSTWIYSAAFNMCKNEYRRQGFRMTTTGSIEDHQIEIRQPEIDHRDFQNVLENILRQSDEGDRNLFVLRYELEMPLSQIATIMDCPEGTVKSRLFYLKKKLALQLRVYNPAIN